MCPKAASARCTALSSRGCKGSFAGGGRNLGRRGQLFGRRQLRNNLRHVRLVQRAIAKTRNDTAVGRDNRREMRSGMNAPTWRPIVVAWKNREAGLTELQ